MKTRKDYMDNKVSHEDYYGQFVTDGVKSIVANRIGIDRIKKSKDRSFNDIPLKEWDDIILSSSIADKVREAGDIYSLSTQVCILKAAARLIKIS